MTFNISLLIIFNEFRIYCYCFRHSCLISLELMLPKTIESNILEITNYLTISNDERKEVNMISFKLSIPSLVQLEILIE